MAALKHREGKRLYAQNLYVAGSIDPAFSEVIGDVEGNLDLGSGDTIDMNGEADALILDADADTTISAPTDDQIDFELNSADHVVMKAVAAANSGTTTNIVEIAATTPVDTTGTNTHNALNIDLEIGNASGGTNSVQAIEIDAITADAQVTATAVRVGTGWDIGVDLSGTKLELDADNDTSIIASTDDQIDVEIGGVNHVILKKVAVADAAATTNIQEIAFTAPVDTTGTNVHNGLNIDIEISNSTGGTNSVQAIEIDAITADAQVVATGVRVGTGWDIGLDLSGTKLELDADNDTSITADTDDQIDIEIKGVDHVVMKSAATADSGATTNIVEIAFTSPVDTTGTNVHNALNIDVEVGNASGGTNSVRALAIDAITGDAQVTETAIHVGSGWDIGLAVDVIAESTGAAGVTIDGALIKDNGITALTHVAAVTGDGAISIPAGNKHYFITKGSAAAMTIADPTATTHDGLTLTFVATTAHAHTLDNSGGSGFFSSGGGTKDVATWGGAIGDGFTIIAYQAKWYIDPRGVTNITLG